MASALVRAGQRPGIAHGDDEAKPMSGADTAAMLAKMRATDASLPGIKQDAAVKLLKWVSTLGRRFYNTCLYRLMSMLACREVWCVQVSQSSALHSRAF